jgi:ferrous iron transport protein B
LFNALTGLNQKVGNYSGVTVEKKTGHAKITSQVEATILDLPGTYSLYPKSEDEYVTYDALFNPTATPKPDIIIVIADASNLKRNLLFASQIIDLKIPVVIALTMMDVAAKKGIEINTQALSIQTGVAIVSINPRKQKGIIALCKQIETLATNTNNYKAHETVNNKMFAPKLIEGVQQLFPALSNYACMHLAAECDNINFLSEDQKQKIVLLKQENNFNKTKIQAEEIMQRYARIKQIMQASVVEEDPLQKERRTEYFDKTLLHPVWGNVILLIVLFLLFQSIFWLASYPMQWIDAGFSELTSFLESILPINWMTNLLLNGVLAGLGGILVFVPQIAILFGLITILEDSGYMARIGFLSDRLMRSVGLNGRAVLPLISGMACAVPAIMATRTIENKKERLIAILVTPFMSCSARIPVYTILIGLVIPKIYYLGFIGLQGLVMMGLYFLGFVLAILASKVLSWLIKTKGKHAFLMELPIYRAPRWRNILITMLAKVKVFVVDAGKVIMVISVLLWALCNYGPGNKIQDIKNKYALVENKTQQANEILGASYAGQLGKIIEPAIKPLGFDWKIGISIIASFAAREVFVGTMATLYSVGDADNENKTLMQKMAMAKNEDGTLTYTLASGMSLLIFYCIALQCMSTLGIVKRETKSWFYPIMQFISLGIIAYVLSWVTFLLLK